MPLSPTQVSAGPSTLNTLGTASTTSGITTKTTVDGGLRRTTITLTAATATWTDNTTTGSSASLKIFDFPEGVINVVGAACFLTAFSSPTNAPLQTGSTTLVFSLGTDAAATDNFTLTALEANIVASTAGGTLTTGAITATAKGIGPPCATIDSTFDGSGTAKDLYINFSADATNSVANGTVTFSATVVISWMNLLDA